MVRLELVELKERAEEATGGEADAAHAVRVEDHSPSSGAGETSLASARRTRTRSSLDSRRV